MRDTGLWSGSVAEKEFYFLFVHISTWKFPAVKFAQINWPDMIVHVKEKNNKRRNDLFRYKGTVQTNIDLFENFLEIFRKDYFLWPNDLWKHFLGAVLPCLHILPISGMKKLIWKWNGRSSQITNRPYLIHFWLFSLCWVFFRFLKQ